MYKLISATPSPYARKVRIQLAEKGIPFELITEVPWNADTQTPRYNPLEKLPVYFVPMALVFLSHGISMNGLSTSTQRLLYFQKTLMAFWRSNVSK
jgi:hypothetical protein